jgi:Flp pilus assembly protein TadD
LRRRRRVAWATAAILVAGLGGVLLIALTRGEELLASALDSRIRLWQQALSLFATDPLSGAGPSTFGWARLAHVPDYVDRVAAKDAHSVPMQTLSDGGVVLALGISLVVVAWVSLVIERRSLLSLQQRLSIAALIGYGAVGLLDDLSFLPAVTVLIILLAAWSIPAAGPPFPRATGRRGLVIPAAVLLAAVAVAPAVVAMTGSRLQAAEGRRAAAAGEWDLARSAFEGAALQQPSNAQHWMSVGLAAAMAGRTDEAIRAYERARSISPGDPRPRGALAALETDEAAEIRLLDEATRRSNDARYAYRLGDALLQAGEAEGAIRSYAIAAAVEPDWFASLPRELWPGVREALPDAIATVGSIGGHRPQEALWNSGLALGVLPDDVGAAWQAVERAMAGDAAGAQEALARARREEPNDMRIDQATAAVARLGCDRDAYERANGRIALRDAMDREVGHPIREISPGVYRDPELGDYQPIAGVTVRNSLPWPLGLIEVPDCGW